MKSFAELESSFGDNNVSAIDDRNLSGYMKLAGPNTTLILSGEHSYYQTRDHNGWFDVTVETTNGRHILLHKSVETLSRMHGHNRKAETHIFPNVVVFGECANLQKVKSISFQIDRLRHFFNYEHIEHQSLWHAPQEILQAIKSIRRSNTERYSGKSVEAEFEHDFFKPSEIYIHHRVLRAFKFQQHDRYYEIGFGGFRKGSGWGGVQIEVEPVARISFGHSINLDDALDAVWEWQLFFEQIAMEEMPMKAIATRATPNGGNFNEIYLPLSERPRDDPDHQMFGLHPSRIPYNRWDHRHKLAGCMKLWLEKQNERKQFRSHLGRVIREANHGYDIDQIVRLCSAIESLSEIKVPSGISKSQVREMSSAATALALENGWEIPATQVQNALSALRRPSLPARLKQMSKALHAILKEEDCGLVIGLAHELRNIAAHGKSHDDYKNPIVGPTVAALTAMCTLFDLHSCGFHKSQDHASLNCLERWNYAVADIRRLSS